jgi:hypothetical protein
MVAPPEIGPHMTVAWILRNRLRQDWLFAHYPAGERNDPRVAAKLKSMGLQKGWPDFILVAPGGCMHCMELKREGGKLSPEQDDFQTHCIKHGIPYVVAHSVTEAMTAFETWGCLKASPEREVAQSADSNIGIQHR